MVLLLSGRLAAEHVCTARAGVGNPAVVSNGQKPRSRGGTLRHSTRSRQYFLGMSSSPTSEPTIRLGQAAEMLGVSVDTLRRWEARGQVQMRRTAGGQRVISLEQVQQLRAERHKADRDRPVVATSARNRFPGIVTRVERDGVAGVIEVVAGPHRLVSLMTAEAVEELDLKVGDEAVCVVKATNVIVEIEGSKELRG
jgi:molybdopterin-binding protein